MPQKYLGWSPERILRFAESIGPSVKELAEKMIASREFPEQAYRGCLGLIRLKDKFGEDRLRLAGERALNYRNFRYHAVKNILEKGLDRQGNDRLVNPTTTAVKHENIRGASYYEQKEEKSTPPPSLLNTLKQTFQAVVVEPLLKEGSRL